MSATQVPRAGGRRARILTGPRVSLRPFEEADLTPRYLAWLNDPEVTRYLEVGKERVTLEQARAYVARFQHSATDLLYAIVDRASGRHIGNVTLNHLDRRQGTADTGLMIGETSFWGRGYATEAWDLLLDHAFNCLGLRTVYAGAVVGHHGSVRVLRRLGFQLEGSVHRAGRGFSWETHRFRLTAEGFRRPPRA